MSGLLGSRFSAISLSQGELQRSFGVQIRAQLLQQDKQEDLGQRWRLHAEEAARYNLVAQPNQEFEVLLAQDLCHRRRTPRQNKGEVGGVGARRQRATMTCVNASSYLPSRTSS